MPVRDRTARDLIVVTGLPRSGTTAMGDALARAGDISQIYEPLNAISGERRISKYFTVPGGDMAAEAFMALVDDLTTLDLRLRRGIYDIDSVPRKVVKLFIGGRSRLSLNRAKLFSRRTLLWKDPFALFAIDSVAAMGHSRIIVTFRHPAAIASSFERLRWHFDVADLEARLRQAGRYPAGAIPPTPSTGSRHVDSALRLYLVGYTYVMNIKERNDAILLVNNADLAARRDVLVSALRQQLGLPPGQPGATLPPVHASAVIPGRVPPTTRKGSTGKPYGRRPHSANRDLSLVNSYYDELLSPLQVRIIEDATTDLQSQLERVAFTVDK